MESNSFATTAVIVGLQMAKAQSVYLFAKAAISSENKLHQLNCYRKKISFKFFKVFWRIITFSLSLILNRLDLRPHNKARHQIDI